ncbi:MAG: VTT domain-containing protein [Leadbetterella sp.]
MQKNKLKNVSWLVGANLALLSILPMIGSVFLGYWVVREFIWFQNPSIPTIILLLLGLSLGCALALCNPTFIAALGGYLYGIWALPGMITINIIAILLITLITKVPYFKQFENIILENKRVQNVLASVHKSEFWFVFYAKLSPLLPFSVANLSFILSKIKATNIILGGSFGMIPRTVLAIYTGAQAKNIVEAINGTNQSKETYIYLFIFLIVSIIGLYFTLKTKKA